jgi:hypothetical protein
LPFPPSQNPDSPTQFHNITVFLTSSDTNLNLTVSNGTDRAPPLGPVLAQEPTSTVKHINWAWPDCLVGDGSDDGGSARGDYNISIHQSFRMNGSDFYTIFALPISVTNEIPAQLSTVSDEPAPGPLVQTGNGRSAARVSCTALSNKFIGDKALAGTRKPSKMPFIGGPVNTGADGTGDGEIGNDSGGDDDGDIGDQSNGDGFIAINSAMGMPYTVSLTGTMLAVLLSLGLLELIALLA